MIITIFLPRFVMRQDVFLRLAVKNVDVVIGEIQRPDPVTRVMDENIIWFWRTANTASNQY